MHYLEIALFLAGLAGLHFWWRRRHARLQMELERQQQTVGRLQHEHNQALAEKQAQLRQLDDQIFGFYRRQPRSFAAAGLAYLAGWLADPLELMILSHLLGFPMDYGTALVIESFISIAKALGFVVPGALGVQESGV